MKHNYFFLDYIASYRKTLAEPECIDHRPSGSAKLSHGA